MTGETDGNEHQLDRNGFSDYTTIGGWEAATDNDLVAAGDIEVGELYADSDFSDTTQRGMTGATTDASNYRILRVASGEEYDLRTGEGVVWNNSNTGRCCQISENYFRLQGPLRLNSTGTTTTTPVLRVHSAGTGVIVEEVIIATTQTRQDAFQLNVGTTVYFNNCMVIDGGGNFDACFQSNNASADMQCNNCVAYAGTFDRGFEEGSGTVEARNCISIGAGTADYEFSVFDTNCIAGDTSTTHILSHNSVVDTDLWVDPSGNDFRIKKGSVGQDGGTDLSGTFTQSIVPGVDHGDVSGSWNIGPYDGYVGGAPVAVLAANHHRRARAHNLTR